MDELQRKINKYEAYFKHVRAMFDERKKERDDMMNERDDMMSERDEMMKEFGARTYRAMSLDKLGGTAQSMHLVYGQPWSASYWKQKVCVKGPMI